jgi:small subunit ribosomal protein S9
MTDKKEPKKVATKKTTKSTAEKKTAVKKKVVVKKSLKNLETPTKSTSSKAPQKQVKKVAAIKVLEDAIYATGRRKESTAKVWIFKGTGVVKINHSDPLQYLSSERLLNKVLTPMNLVSLAGKYDVRIDVQGGGLTGQAEAATLGVARAVLSISEDFRSVLRANGLLTQDRREKERKKYGKRGARKSPQFRKR